MKINKKYRQTYHANVPSAWSNDPNGMIFYKGKAHMFFQHYPHAAKWGIMHWGHFVSDDFIKWKTLPIALYPDQEYEKECGCCSGTSIEADGILYIIYTAAQINHQSQCLAYSEDGIHFTKYEMNPIMTAEDLSDEISPRDFRDPKIFKKDNMYYCIAGTRLLDEEDKLKLKSFKDLPHSSDININNVAGSNAYVHGYGNLILLKSDDLKHWSYIGPLLRLQKEIREALFKLNGVFECPDYFEIDGQEILLASPQNYPSAGHSFNNLHSCIYAAGHLNLQTGNFVVHKTDEIDHGFDFYAPQTLKTDDGRIILIAWKEMWDRTYPTETDQWIGSYTLPRELYYKNDHLYQSPVREIMNYRKNKKEVKDITLTNGSISFKDIEGNKIELIADIGLGSSMRTGFKLMHSKEHAVYIYYDRSEKVLVFDRSNSGYEIFGREDETAIRKCDIYDSHYLNLHIFIDVSSIEVFINNGIDTMTGNIYGDPKKDIGITFFADNGTTTLDSLIKYDIVVE
ncbi:sucrose-6-phosphate hydrolase [Eggerthia catenaformis]|uniref:glycoside hydrolase family 32 protein n=1 Tax=Eggerthia catenaformis TaxID=31973 RepID=UPI0028ED90FA|nr:sucrose-6-phosphate hydrolase [Eggerthia catenaformis]